MLADPQTVTVNAVPISLPRVSEGPGGGPADYNSADGINNLRTTQTTSVKQKRHAVSFRTAKIAADPISGLNSRVFSTITVSVARPVDGFTVTEIKDQLVGLATWLTASSAANALKVIQGEK